MEEMGKEVRAKVKTESKEHHAKKSRLVKAIKRYDSIAPDQPEKYGSMAPDRSEKYGSMAPDQSHLVTGRASAVDALMLLHEAEQRRWFADRGYERAAKEDTCWRGFFEETRDGRKGAHVEYLSETVHIFLRQRFEGRGACVESVSGDSLAASDSTWAPATRFWAGGLARTCSGR